MGKPSPRPPDALYPIRMEMRPPLLVAGLKRRTSLHDDRENGTVSSLMNDFFALHARTLPARVKDHEIYGILDFSEEEPNSGWFHWIAAAEVSDLAGLPDGFVGREYPTLLYAVATYRGTVEGLPNVFDEMYQRWLPHSPYESAAPFAFQLYGDRYRGPFDPSSEIDVFFPVRPKSGSTALPSGMPLKSRCRFGAVFVPVTDLARAIVWYSRLFGIPVDPGFDPIRDSTSVYRFQVGNTDILLDNVGASPIDNPNVLFYVSVASLQGMYEDLRSIGADLLKRDHPSDASDSFVVRDPDGNRLMLMEDRSRGIGPASAVEVRPYANAVPNLLYDGGSIDVLFDGHDDAVKRLSDLFEWGVRRRESWSPDPRAKAGRMTQLEFGTWIVSALTDRRLPHHFAERGTLGGHVRWCWRTNDLDRLHERLKTSDARISEIYQANGGIRYAEVWATAEGIRFTIQEDRTCPSGLHPSWTRIGVRRLDEAVRWYETYMGMRVHRSETENGYAILTLGVNHHPEEASLWVLEQLPPGVEAMKFDDPVRPYCYVESRQQFFAYHAFLRDEGLAVSDVGGFAQKGLTAFHFYDPDGNRINIVTY